MKSVTKILMYHSIGKTLSKESGAGLYTVSVENFIKQMQVVGGRLTYEPRPEVTITFDDGDLTNYQYAYPTLREFGLSAYFFIIVPKVATPGYMNWEKIRELKEHGMIIGSHGMTHRILKGLSDRELGYEIKDSKKILEDKLGSEIKHFSIPKGFNNKRIIEKARESGYAQVFTSNPDDNDGFKIGRIAVKKDWDMDYFNCVIENGLPLKDKVKESVKNSLKKVLGAKSYDRIRTKILQR